MSFSFNANQSKGTNNKKNPHRVKVGVAFLNGKNKQATESMKDGIQQIMDVLRQNELRLVIRPPYEDGKVQPWPEIGEIKGSIFVFPTDLTKVEDGKNPPDFDVIGFTKERGQ